MAHFPGCPHKDDDDFTRWGYITLGVAEAWQSLGNGRPVAAVSGGQPHLIATTRCSTCDVHGTWS